MSHPNPGSLSTYASVTAKPGQYEAMTDSLRHSCDLNKETPGLVQMLCLEPPKESPLFLSRSGNPVRRSMPSQKPHRCSSFITLQPFKTCKMWQ